MSIQTIGTLEAKTQWSALLARVRKGERFFIARHGQLIAELRPIEQRRVARKPGFAKGTFTHVTEDFDEPLDDFAEYT